MPSPGQPFLLRWQLLFLAGIIGLFLSGAPLAAGLALPLLILFALPRLRAGHGILAVFCCCALGALLSVTVANPRSASQAPMPRWMASGAKVSVTARVLRTESKSNQRLRILLADVVCTPEGQNAWPLPAGLVLTWLQPAFRPAPGDKLRTRLRVKPVHNFANTGTWDVENYWAQRGMRYRAFLYKQRESVQRLEPGHSALQRMRNRIMADALEVMGGEQGLSQGKAVIFALLFGERYYIRPGTERLLRHCSLSHSLALSGLHVGFAVSLGALLGFLFCRVFPQVTLHMARPKFCMLFGLLVAAPYVWLGNATPSLLRAFLMFAVWTVLLLRGSPRVILDGLFIALALLLLYDPQLAFDLRLQLSAAAVAGIACFIDLRGAVAAFFKRKNTPSGPFPPAVRKLLLYPLDLLGVSLAAQLASLPLVIGSFGQVPLNPLPNLLWLPLLFLVLPSSVLALLLAFLHLPQAAAVLMDLTALPLATGLRIFERLQDWHAFPSLLCLRPHALACTGYWGVLLCAFLGARLLLTARDTPKKSAFPRLAYLCSACLLFFPALAGTARLSNPLRLTMLDVGQGQALFLETPRGKRMLIDGGGLMSPTFDVGEAVVAPALTQNQAPGLDWAVLSHPDNDHLRGLLFILSHFRIGTFAYNGCLPQNRNLAALPRILRERGLRPKIWRRNKQLTLEPGLVLQVLHPSLETGCKDSNNASLCLRLVWNGRGLALLPGDIGLKGLHTLLTSGQTLAAQVLMLPHHGSASGLNRSFYDAAAPRVALCSAGFLNHFHFPDQKVSHTLAALEIPLFTTARQGAMTATWQSADAAFQLRSIRSGMLSCHAQSGE